MESLIQQSSCLGLLMQRDGERCEVGGCKMLTAEFSDGGKTGALLFEVHLHFRS